ncbi:MAG: hypothetical protein KC609_16070 [Myxococcales bacterium]|nr:hypothetical protein [Myxococcales bacterium]
MQYLATIFTESFEFHVSDGLCVAVRDRGTSEWLKNHPARYQRLYDDETLVYLAGLRSPSARVRLQFQGSRHFVSQPILFAICTRRDDLPALRQVA